MGRMLSGGTGRWPRAGRARGRFPARTLHLIDVENLAGTGMPSSWEVRDVQDIYSARVGLGAIDQVIVGCNHLALLNAWVGWPGARYLIRSGRDGADLELLGVVRHEDIAARFTHVTIASGDGAFTPAAAALAAAGCQVTVVSRRSGLSRNLALAAERVIYIDVPDPAEADPVPRKHDAA